MICIVNSYTILQEVFIMDFRLLEYFLAVAREQNITTAAESLHISQPALSTQLKNLEEELGKQLLIRGVKGSSIINRRRDDFT